MLPTISHNPRRYVDRRGNRTTVTRRSAPARITALPSTPTVPVQLPIETALPFTAARPRLSAKPKPFSLSPIASRTATAPARASRRTTIDFDDSDSSGNETDASYNSFLLTLKKKDILRLDTQLAVGDTNAKSSSIRSEASPTRSLKSSGGSQQTTVYRVLKSHYEGDLFRNSKLKAQLVIIPGRRSGQPETVKPLFKWVHVENPEMRFGAFLEYVTRCPYLDDSERDSVGSILRTAREKSDRSLRLPPGMTGTYVEPEYFEETIETTVYQGPRTKGTRRELVRWLAVPYFFLTPTSSQNAKFIPASNHDKYPSFIKKGSIAHGDFFQVAQLWCVMVGDEFLVTCTRMPVTELPETLMKLDFLPPTDTSTGLSGDRAPTMQVWDGGLRLWLLPVEQCETWAAFVANFVGLGFSLVDGWQVKYKDIVLDPNDWSSIVTIAKKSTIRLELSRGDATVDTDTSSSEDDSDTSMPPGSPAAVEVSDEQPTSLLAQPSPVTSGNTEQPGSLDGTDLPVTPRQKFSVDEFHVFTLLATIAVESPKPLTSGSAQPKDPSAILYRVDELQLQQDLSELDNYLSCGNSRKSECASYEGCPVKTTYDVESSVSTLSGLSGTDSDDFHRKRRFARAARDIFEFFLPLRYHKHVVVKKYWGGVDRIIQAKMTKIAQDQFEDVVKDIINLARVATEIRRELFAEKNISTYMTTIPHEFLQAWMLIQMFIISFSPTHALKYSNHLRRCKERLMLGRLKMIERLQPVNLRDREAVTPLGLTLLLLGQLLHDSQGPLTPERHRLTSAYWSFFKDLKQKVYAKPLYRKYEATFTSLKSAFETIIAQLEDQQRVLVALEDSINEAESRSFASSTTASKAIRMEPSREASVTEYVLHQTEEMLQNFAEMSRRLNDLENWHFLSLSIDNDMQQKATFAFTTVTVFFLPLTTLAGILGMNTNDIRNLNDDQWLFWSIAIPLSIFCLSAWFIYLGTFEKAWRWSKQHGRRVPQRE
ncbi:hypothetical protein EJ04DRAFT_577557 [Polyplosphaeria fusca]|uniref:Uncharacterized protein n=1 Tax=Polyplosphaeria fusca TaxID=682080 RepID=A0A9P4QYF2_9PLEO|nr:hypothetical protein EJ04DRAFT_577557 [Polyplosphaeria fusca]